MTKWLEKLGVKFLIRLLQSWLQKQEQPSTSSSAGGVSKAASTKPLLPPRMQQNQKLYMKKLFLSTILVACSIAAQAQTTDTNALADSFKATTMEFVDGVTTASNWNFHVEALYVDAWKSHYGVREGFDYKLSDGTYTSLSLIEGNNTIYGVSGNVGLKQHWSLFQGKVQIVTAEKVGVITTLSGQKFGSFVVPGDATHSGEWAGVIGSDLIVSPQYKYCPDFILGYEKHSNLSGNIFSFGIHAKLANVFSLIGISN